MRMPGLPTLLLALVLAGPALADKPLSPTASAVVADPARTAQPDEQSGAAGTAVAAKPEVITLSEGLAISDVVEGGRVPFPRDAVAQLIIDGTFTPPRPGDAVTGLDGQARTWQAAQADAQGQFAPEVGRRGYLFVNVPSDRDRVMILHTIGNAMTYVNGEPRVGDPYAYGFVHLPVRLNKGDNAFLFAMAGRGPMRATLIEPTHEVMLNAEDLTLPDVLVRTSDNAPPSLLLVDELELDAGVVVMNLTDEPMSFEVGSRCDKAATPWSKTFDGADALPPLSIRKVPIKVLVPDTLRADAVPFTFWVRRANGEASHSINVTLRIRTHHQAHKRTFLSGIDGSAQYYAVLRPTPGSTKPGGPWPSLVLSLHGAGVEAIGQAEAYSPKVNQYIVCPTNRRPFGFDWEDWGAIDALEVLAMAQRRFKTAPDRVYLTGHSMGGHGTWNLAVNHPHLFAAIAPSAGWLSFNTYTAARGPGGNTETSRSPVPADAPVDERLADLFRRSTASSDTIALLDNLRGKGIYILHGDADDNVPVSEARRARDELTKLGIPIEYHEQPGAEHWWDDDQPGAACVDWPPIFEMFANHELPSLKDTTDFNLTTLRGFTRLRDVSIPGAIDAQTATGLPSTLSIKVDRSKREVVANATNCESYFVNGWWFAELGVKPEPVTYSFNGEKFEDTTGRAGHIVRRTADGWALQQEVHPDVPDSVVLRRAPNLLGPFKRSWHMQFVSVYGTQGSDELNRAMFAKARYDGEQWWYRGNGQARIVADHAFEHNSLHATILYGNPEINAAWNSLWPAAPEQHDIGHGRHLVWPGLPVTIADGSFRLGERNVGAPSTASLFSMPCIGEQFWGSCAAIAATDARGMRATFRLPYFVSGVGYPDLTVFTPNVAREGMKAVQGAGFFGPDWTVEKGEWVWRDDKK